MNEKMPHARFPAELRRTIIATVVEVTCGSGVGSNRPNNKFPDARIFSGLIAIKLELYIILWTYN